MEKLRIKLMMLVNIAIPIITAFFLSISIKFKLLLFPDDSKLFARISCKIYNPYRDANESISSIKTTA